MKRHAGLLSAAILLTTSCSDGTQDSSDRYQVEILPSGLVQVSNDGRGIWTPETAWTLEQDLRLGTVDEEGPEQFSQVAWITEDERGRIFILDYPAQDIRVFNPSGEHLYTFARSGQGPGELQGAAGINWAPDGNLWVWGSRRYSVFEPSGEFVTSYSRNVRGVIYPWNGGFIPDAQYVDWGLDRERGLNPNETTGLTTMYPIKFTPPSQLDTMPPLVFQAWMRSETQMVRGRNKGIALAQADDGHIWFAETDEYTLFERTMEGDTLLAFSIPSRPLEVSDAEKDSIIQLYVERGIPDRPTRDEFAPYHRLVTRVIVDNAGHIYVFPREPGVPEGSAVDVFADDGVYLGRMEFGEIVLTLGPPPFMTTSHIYAVVNDEYDVPFVVRWRIVKPVQQSDRTPQP